MSSLGCGPPHRQPVRRLAGRDPGHTHEVSHALPSAGGVVGPHLRRRWRVASSVTSTAVSCCGNVPDGIAQPWSLKCSTWWVLPEAMITSPWLTTVSGVA